MESMYEYFTDGPFNQGYPCSFTVLGRIYSSAEQYMMAYKAVTFFDIESFNKIVQETDYVKLKALGRGIKNFDKEKWDAECQRVVAEGNWAKFTQNPHLCGLLLQTHGKQLVYRSEDSIWGNGMLNVPEFLTEEVWGGKNLLGKILTEIRGTIVSKIQE
jgi:ribA/ribD-fused uncharacterized protein